MKKLIILFFAIAASINIAFADDSGTCGDNLQWYYNSTTHELLITGNGPMWYFYSESEVPWKSFLAEITSVSLPNGLTSIGRNAFSRSKGLTSMVIPNSVTIIEQNAFFGCTGLTSVTIPNSVTSIGYGAFRYCTSLTSVTIPNSVTSIGNEAFQYCTSLTSVTIPNSVTSIGNEAFDDVANIVYNGSATGSPWGARNVNAYVDDYFVYSDENRTNLIACPYAATGSIIIPDGVTSIGNQAFYNCSSLTSVTIPNSVTSIGDWAFYGCTGLTSVTIPESVTSIGVRAFNNCIGLSCLVIPNSVTFIGGMFSYIAFENVTIVVYNGSAEGAPWGANAVYPVKEGYFVFSDVDKTNLVRCLPEAIGEISIPASVTTIADNAFQNCDDITNINIPNSVTSIGNEIFSGCTSLTAIDIPNSVTSIGNNAFYNCSSLTSVTIPNSVTSIGNGAFYGCTALTSIIIPNSVTSIGGSAFCGCTGLTSVTIPNSVTSIGGSAFSVCTGLTSIIIPNSVTSIGNGAFSGCTGLTSIIIPNSVTSIGGYAFRGCTGLTSVTIPNSVPSIGNEAFSGCTGLTSIIIPNSVTSIGNEAFTGCSGLTSVTIGNGVASIGRYAFSRCTGLTSIIIPNSVTSIGDRAFTGCSGLTSVTIPNSVTSIGDDPFDGTELTEPVYNAHVFAYMPTSYSGSYTISYGIETIAGSAFRFCTGLTSVVIPNSVTSIGYSAFSDCTGLTSVTIGNNVTSMGRFAFERCNSINTVYLGATTPPAFSTAISNSDDLVVYVPLGSLDAYLATDWNVYNLQTYMVVANVDDELHGYVEITENYVGPTIFVISVEAIPNYGYHFTQWSDGVTDIQRTFTQPTVITAEFEPNQYSLTLDNNSVNGFIYGESGAFDYLTELTIEAVPNEGYHLTEWSDGVTENPRILTLTQDTVLSAAFEIDRLGTCGENNALTWEYNTDSKTLTISGVGALTENYTYGLEAPVEVETIIIGDDVTSIGAHAFENFTSLLSLKIGDGITTIGEYAFAGCTEMMELSLGSGLREIDDYAFSLCKRVEAILVAATRVVDLTEYSFYNIGHKSLIPVYVPNGRLINYQRDLYWSEFDLRVRDDAQIVEEPVEVVVITPHNDNADVVWPVVDNAYSYELTVRDSEGNVILTLTFNANGQLTGIAFHAPARNEHSNNMAQSGFRFTITGLDGGSTYNLIIDAKNNAGEVLETFEQSFTTSSGQTTALEGISADGVSSIRKVIEDGKVVIVMPDGRRFDASGRLLK